MKKVFKIFLMLVMSFIGSVSFAQVSADPQDVFYEDAQNWLVKGYIEQLPPLRPYPMQNIESILTQVMEKGNDHDKAIAKAHYERLTGKLLYIYGEIGVKDAFKSGSQDKNTLGSMNYGGVAGDMDTMEGMLSMGYNGGISLTNKKENQVLPMFDWGRHDSYYDPVSLDPFKMCLDMNMIMAAGTENFYAQAGVNRLGFGDFLNSGFALNDNAYHAPTISFTYMGNNWSYAQVLRVLGATENSFDLTKEPEIFPNKYLAFHEASAMFAKNLQMTYYESVVFGGRFDPSYITPMTYMVCQNFSGFDDNFQLGIKANYRIMKGLHWNTDFYLDDINANQVLRLNFDTRMRFALATGIIYAPEMPLVENVKFDVQAIMPYMYCHWNFDAPKSYTLDEHTVNYQNYTNCGFPVGSTYAPDSVVVNAQTTLRPMDNLKVDLAARFIAHGNVAEDSTEKEAMEYLLKPEGTYSTDGSEYTQTVYLDPTAKHNYRHTAASEKFNLLTQDHLMYVLQADAKATYDFKPWDWCNVSLYSGLSLEGVFNKGVDSNIFPGGKTQAVKDESGNITGYIYDGNSYGTASEVVDAARADWASAMYNTMNVYFSIGAKVRF